MSKIDDPLNRLLRGAAKATDAFDSQPPPGFVRRVLAEVNALEIAEVDFATSLVCQRTLFCTLCLVLGCVLLSFHDLASLRTWPLWPNPQARLIESVVRLDIP